MSDSVELGRESRASDGCSGGPNVESSGAGTNKTTSLIGMGSEHAMALSHWKGKQNVGQVDGT